jgi:hypothetical protein
LLVWTLLRFDPCDCRVADVLRDCVLVTCLPPLLLLLLLCAAACSQACRGFVCCVRTPAEPMHLCSTVARCSVCWTREQQLASAFAAGLTSGAWQACTICVCVCCLVLLWLLVVFLWCGSFCHLASSTACRSPWGGLWLLPQPRPPCWVVYPIILQAGVFVCVVVLPLTFWGCCL